METFKHQQVSDEEVIILPREMYEKFMKLKEKSECKVRKSKNASFSQTAVYRMCNYIATLVSNAPIKAELRDPNGNLIKTFTSLNELAVDVEGDKVYLRVRIIDSSTDSYTFRYLKVWERYGESDETCVYHTFSQNYTKGSDQIADIKVRTGISGCYLG
jgi:hypothetical protein